MIEEREELTNQECRDLKGSLSDRGCYSDKAGNTLEGREGADTFLCHDCGKDFDMKYENLAEISVQGRKAVVPICSGCVIIREEK